MTREEYITLKAKLTNLIHLLEHKNDYFGDDNLEYLSFVKEMYIVITDEFEDYFDLETEKDKYGTINFNIKKILNLKRCQKQ